MQSRTVVGVMNGMVRPDSVFALPIKDTSTVKAAFPTQRMQGRVAWVGNIPYIHNGVGFVPFGSSTDDIYDSLEVHNTKIYGALGMTLDRVMQNGSTLSNNRTVDLNGFSFGLSGSDGTDATSVLFSETTTLLNQYKIGTSSKSLLLSDETASLINHNSDSSTYSHLHVYSDSIVLQNQGQTVLRIQDNDLHLPMIPNESGFDTVLVIENGIVGKKIEPSGGGVDPEFYGTIYSENTWANLSDFTNNAGATIVGGDINFTAGAGNYTQTLEYNYYTGLERWNITARVVINSIGAASYGFGVGLKSANTQQQYSVQGRIGFFTGNTNAPIWLDVQNNGVWANGRTTARTVAGSAGDTILLSLTRDVNVITCVARNLTTDNAIDTTYTYITDSTMTVAMPNTARFAIYSFGGDFTVDSLAISSKEVKNAAVMVVGDSKTAGYNATDIYTRYSNLIAQQTTSLTINAGGWDRTQEVLLKMPEIIALSPKQLLLAIGSNDRRSGVTLDSFKARFARIVTQSEAAGVTDAIPLLPFYETSQDMSEEKVWMESTYADNIDTWTPTKWGGSLVADGVHPGTVGNVRIAEKVLSSLNIKDATSIISTFALSASAPPTPPTPTLQEVTDEGNSITNAIRITGIGNLPASGSGLELLVYSGMGWVGAYNRTGGVALPLVLNPGGNTFVGDATTPTAKLHITGGTATAGTAPLKFTSGTGLSVPEAGAVEYVTPYFFFTNGESRKILGLIHQTAPANTADGTGTEGNFYYDDSYIYIKTSAGWKRSALSTF
jgi:lysophospholipase L1-like esterase